MNIYLRSITKIHKNPYPPPQLHNFSKILKKSFKPPERRFNRIGASECLERDRGPGGPPSGMEWSAFAKQNKKRSLFLCWTRARLPPAYEKGPIRGQFVELEGVEPSSKQRNHMLSTGLSLLEFSSYDLDRATGP